MSGLFESCEHDDFRTRFPFSVFRFPLPASRFPLPPSRFPLFTFSLVLSTFASMTARWFGATYYYVFIGYSRWGPRSRVR